jgi:hypothetical protein
MPSLRY